MQHIKSYAINALLIFSLCVGTANAGIIAAELKDFVPVVIMDRDELNKQLIEMQKCTPVEAAIPLITGAASALLYNDFYKKYKKEARYTTDSSIAENRFRALEGALTGVCIHMAKQVLFRAIYGNTEKAKAMNSLDTMATLTAFLGFNTFFKD